ncbi:hypothetical protein B0A77_14655 [Flavobacterium branchiophilum]|uniref:Uncharacterized protein n=1 Tax=Flavobacterium branchiophilum TaxID=55197 RepID=A0A2H3KMZ3_9FLAO|nr:hypothetical protein B0A77_14655 [Flavobacterium branchiophilum]
MYKVISKDNPYDLKKRDHYYLDNFHKDHVEVFDKNGNAKKVLNLDGSLNVDKTNKILEEKRTIKIK